jgi:Short C-terminal domain
MGTPRVSRSALLIAVILGFGTLASPLSASAETGSEEVQGAQLLQSVQQGSKSCSDLSDSGFELVGEAWMGQALGGAEAHESMNRLMAAMMGSSGEAQMHEYMGRRVSGCGGGSLPSGFARMMGMMVVMGGGYGPGTNSGQGFGPGMMGGQSSAGGGYGGSMMGGYPAAQNNDNDDNGPSAGAMVGMMAVPILAILLALLIFKPWRRSGTALERLGRRFANGELSAEEYRQSKQLLEGGRTQ